MTAPGSARRTVAAASDESADAGHTGAANATPTDHAAGGPLARRHARLFGAYLIGLSIILLWLLVSLWPQSVPMEASGSGQVELFGLIELTVGTETRLLLLVVVAGALGSYVHLATSFADYAGNRRLVRSWLMWYALRPFIGTALAVIVYFVLRGGLFTGADTTGALNPYGIAAVAALTGMFSKQASDKLREVFENLFSTDQPVERADPLPVEAASGSRAAFESTASAAGSESDSDGDATVPVDDASPTPPVHAGGADES